jgi:DNA repair exonuclease SbcCD ATPase subunit
VKIIELRVKNFCKLSAVSIRPDGTVNVISGANDQGKSSLLLAIWTLFKIKGAPAEMIREGEEQCRLEADTGEYKIVRTFTRKNGTEVTHDLKVKRADGSSVTKPQSVLNLLAPSDLAFDPLEFTRWPEKQQYETLQKFVKGFDFADNKTRRDMAFAKRTDVNRLAKEWRASAARVTLPEGPEPPALDVSAKIAEVSAAERGNTAIEAERRRRSADRAKATEMTDRAESLRAEADALDAKAAEALATLAALPPLGTPQDISALLAEIAAAEKTTATRALFAERRKAEEKAEEQERQSASLTAAINALDEAKKEAIAAAKMPVDGLGFDDEKECVTLNGVPFAQAGMAVKIRTAAAINMALNPELKIMTIDQGEALDSASLAALDAMCGDTWQLFITKVDESGQGDFVIVDGHLKEES